MNGDTKRKVKGWGAVLGIVGAMAGAGINGLVSMREIEARENRDAYQRAQLEKVWDEVRADIAARDEQRVKLREAVAELRGALEQMHRGRMESALRGGAVDKLMGLKMREGGLDKVESLPEPEPERVQAAKSAQALE